MIPDEFKSDMVELTGLVAPEIAQPAYIVAHPRDVPIPPGCDGYAPTYTNSLFKDILVHRGEWRGPGPMVVLVDKFPRDSGGNRLTMAGLFLHELAHHLPHVPLDDAPDGENIREVHMQFCRTWASQGEWPRNSPRWFPVHGADFTRICLHLHFRAMWNGLRLDLDSLGFAGPDYDLSYARQYQQAIGDEPGEMLDRTFAEILASPLPQAFEQLFSNDQTRWQQTQRKP